MINVLDPGHVRLVDQMGSDAAIVQAARVSYGEGTKTVQDDTALVRYLMRHHHTTPFEMCQLKFHIKCPIFVARQWHRHRTASINEISARYSVLPEEYYVPDPTHVQAQSISNKQGREGKLAYPELTSKMIAEESQRAYKHYISMIESDVARELARTVLPVNFYTEFYWSLNLHNLFHFLHLRLDEHAQYEIRMYAGAIAETVSQHYPIAYQAFLDYRVNAVHISSQAYTALCRMLNGEKVDQTMTQMGQREWSEFQQLFGEPKA